MVHEVDEAPTVIQDSDTPTRARSMVEDTEEQQQQQSPAEANEEAASVNENAAETNEETASVNENAAETNEKPKQRSTKLYCGGFGEAITSDQIRDLFAPFGFIVHVRRCHGFAFIEFENRKDAENAIRNLDRSVQFGSGPINVQIAKDQSGKGSGTLEPRCFGCGKTGHTLAVCPDPAPRDSCFHCRRPGHVVRDCPDRLLPPRSSAPAVHRVRSLSPVPPPLSPGRRVYSSSSYRPYTSRDRSIDSPPAAVTAAAAYGRYSSHSRADSGYQRSPPRALYRQRASIDRSPPRRRIDQRREAEELADRERELREYRERELRERELREHELRERDLREREQELLERERELRERELRDAYAYERGYRRDRSPALPLSRGSRGYYGASSPPPLRRRSASRSPPAPPARHRRAPPAASLALSSSSRARGGLRSRSRSPPLYEQRALAAYAERQPPHHQQQHHHQQRMRSRSPPPLAAHSLYHQREAAYHTASYGLERERRLAGYGSGPSRASAAAGAYRERR